MVAVGGFASNSGKTTLLCELLRAFPGWEAIKVTRGHYRSCGKDPAACCVSPLLGAEPLVRTGRAETYAVGKDTGGYWNAGASNVHWVIATDGQIEAGIKQALLRVASPGVFIEGNSFLKFVEVDFALMVARGAGQKMKTSARRAIPRTSAFYLSDDPRALTKDFAEARQNFVAANNLAPDAEVYGPAEISRLVARIENIHSGRGKSHVSAAMMKVR